MALGSGIVFLVLGCVAFVQVNSAGCPYSSPPTTICTDPNSEFRPVDGSLRNGCRTRGKPLEGYGRIANPNYGNCQWAFRKSASNTELPPVRSVVNNIRTYQRPVSPNSPVPNFLIAMLGQFIAHDIGNQRGFSGSDISTNCCIGEVFVNSHPYCIGFEISSDDSYYSQFNTQCMRVFRSRPINETASPVEQINHVTAFLDASVVYGNDASTTASLRSGVDGKMLTDSDNIFPKNAAGAWFTGDQRFQQTPQLAVIQSIFLREHNRVAGILKGINPNWTDERIFQETRRIVIAELQHITYEEFLPAFVSPAILALIDLPDSAALTGTFTYNEFNNGIFRLFHGMIPGEVEFISADGTVTPRNFKSMLINNGPLIKNYYDDVIRGLLLQPIFTGGWHQELLKGVFGFNETSRGYDQFSVDMQRGRDHGLAAYVDVLAQASGLPISSFAGLRTFMSQGDIELLQNAYDDVTDIDLMSGALLETPLAGSLLGPTSQYLFMKQFSLIKNADPYFYTNKLLNPKPFTAAQLNEIKKATTNLLFCTNANVNEVPSISGFAPSTPAHVVLCNDLPQMSFDSWRE